MNMNNIFTTFKRVLLLITILSFYLSAMGSCSSDDSDNGAVPLEEWHEPLRIGTYNIQYDNLNDPSNPWNSRNTILEKLLKEYDFDILGAQEPYLGQINDMMKYMDNYTYIGKDITGGIEELRRHYVPIFYKKDKFDVLRSGMFWLSETPNIANSKGWDAYSVRICVWAQFKHKETGNEFYHFNVHFDHIGTTARQESAKLIVSKIKEIAGDQPNFVTGDFNSNQKSVPYNTIVTSGIVMDSYSRSEDKVNANWPTYNGYKYISTPPANASRIDHVFVTTKGTKVKSWQLINADYSQKYPSDHYPVLIEWCFRK